MGYERHVACAVLPADDHFECVRGEVEGLTAALRRICASNFPVRQGYLTLSEPLDDGQLGVRLRVIHNDFCGDVELAVDFDGAPAAAGSTAIRVRTSAGSQELARLEHLAARWVAFCRPAGAGLGALLVIAGTIALGGIGNLLFAAMFVLVLAVALPMVGWSVGGFVGERLASGTHDRAIDRVCSDGALQRDLLRWKAVSRHLVARRRHGRRGRRLPPFRR
ncbi:MAG: hypothetical protein B7733_03400 [Myxococcales bacterium FL481]|nr:MAG: hypothetical protein B7733_03400 [Myxococcales bacterium FL481]